SDAAARRVARRDRERYRASGQAGTQSDDDRGEPHPCPVVPRRPSHQPGPSLVPATTTTGPQMLGPVSPGSPPALSDQLRPADRRLPERWLGCPPPCHSV